MTHIRHTTEHATGPARGTRIPLDVLRNVQIAAPCMMNWDDMTPVAGSEGRVRHCDACRLNVHDISAMSADEATDLLGREDGLCVRLYRRPDGTVMTQDCPVGLAAIRRRARRMVLSATSAVVASLLTVVGLFGRECKESAARLRSVEPFRTIAEKVSPTPPTTMTVTPAAAPRVYIMGAAMITPATGATKCNRPTQRRS